MCVMEPSRHNPEQISLNTKASIGESQEQSAHAGRAGPSDAEGLSTDPRLPTAPIP